MRNDRGDVNNTKTTTTPDEIDLVELFVKFSLIVQKHYKVILMFLAAGILGAILVYANRTPVYQSSMLLKNNFLDRGEVAGLVATLNHYAVSGNVTLLSETLDVPASVGKVIRGVSISEEPANSANPSGLKLAVQVDRQSYLPEIQQGIVVYLSNTPFCAKRMETEKESKTRLLTILAEEEKNLDSMQNAISTVIRKQDPGFMALDLAGLVQQKIKLREDQLRLQSELKVLAAFEVIQGFPAANPVSSMKGSIIFVIGVFAALFLSAVVIAFAEWSEYVRRQKSEVTYRNIPEITQPI